MYIKIRYSYEKVKEVMSITRFLKSFENHRDNLPLRNGITRKFFDFVMKKIYNMLVRRLSTL